MVGVTAGRPDVPQFAPSLLDGIWRPEYDYVSGAVSETVVTGSAMSPSIRDQDGLDR